MSVEVFGHLGDTPVQAVTISGGEVTAKVMEWGSVLVDLRLDGVAHPLTVGFDDFETYAAHGQHVGAIAGRFAGRIAGGFEVDGRRYETTLNNGPATLHGGEQGMGVSLWSLQDHGADFVEMAIRQPDDLDGFPGGIDARCRYETADGALRLTLTAISDAPTLCNLAQHSYFNLSGAKTVDDHMLQLAAEQYTPLDDVLLPTGEIAVIDAKRDFRTPRRIGETQLDGHFVLAEARRASPTLAAVLTGDDVEMTVETTEPGLVVYTADKFPDTTGGLNDRRYGPRAGLCLECQLWPDAPNQPGFPSAVLRPGETYRQDTVYRLKRLSR